jgi:6-hydroxytryprostatin B O-methyltransferase
MQTNWSTRLVNGGEFCNPLYTGPNLNAEPGDEKTFFQIVQVDDDGEWNGAKDKGFRLARLYDSERCFTNSGTTNVTGLLAAYDRGRLGK